MNPAPSFADCWFLSGPTASGKTRTGVALARLGAEIISLDSMAVYRGMDIGTAKPTAEERADVPHHLIDVADPGQDFSVAQYVAAAERVVADLAARGQQALFVGGTPLYLKSLLRGLFVGPPADWELRTRLMQWAREAGPEALHRRLAAIDPVTARRLPAADTRRVIRALEVYEQCGQPISALQQQFDRARPADEGRVFVLEWPRPVLYERIQRRVDAMFAAGLVDEVRGLAAQGRSLGRTAAQAVGYREVLQHLAGSLSLADTIELIKTRSRQFAKRQLTWFRSLSECRTVLLDGPLDADRVAEQIFRQGAP